MKKLLALLLGATLALSMTGCSSEEALTPEEIYDQAIAKSQELDAVDGDMTISMDMDMGGMSLSMGMDARIQLKNATSGDMEMAMILSTDVLGTSMQVEEYFKDGYFYMSDGTTKVKAPFDYSEVAGQAQMNTATARDFMEKLEMTEDENGNYVFTYSIAQDRLNDYLDGALEGMDDILGETGSFVINEMNGTCVIDKEYNVISDNVHMDMDMTAEGQSLGYVMDISIEYNAVGDAVTVSFPDDLDSYEEVDHDVLAGAMAA